MDSEQFRKHGKEVIDFIADFYDNVREHEITPSIEPGHVAKSFPKDAPEKPDNWQTVFEDFSRTILPGVTSWNSPQFHGYYPSGASYASILGSILTEGLGTVGVTWISNPVCTELEMVTLNWLGKLLGLPEEFLNCSSGPGGGVIQGHASEAVFVCLSAAKDKMIRKLISFNSNLNEDEIRSKLVAYSSDQSNSSVEKACRIGSVKIRLLKADNNGKLRGETLRKAMEVDKSMGLIPFFVVATLGTTGICAFDPLDELGPICEENKAWLHIDAAYAGSAFICEEYRYLMNGIDYADSFNVNTHKWLLVNVGCSAMWVKDGFDVVQAMNVQRIYLDDVQGVPNYRHWQLPLGRKFSALKLWTVLKMYGGEGLRNHIRSQVGFAQYFADLVRSDERFVVEPEPSMGLTCIRLVESDKMTRKLLDNLVASKQIFMVPTTFRNRFLIRVVICSHFTTKEDIDVSWDIIKRETDILVPPGNRISID